MQYFAWIAIACATFVAGIGAEDVRARSQFTRLTLTNPFRPRHVCGLGVLVKLIALMKEQFLIAIIVWITSHPNTPFVPPGSPSTMQVLIASYPIPPLPFMALIA